MDKLTDLKLPAKQTLKDDEEKSRNKQRSLLAFFNIITTLVEEMQNQNKFQLKSSCHLSELNLQKFYINLKIFLKKRLKAKAPKKLKKKFYFIYR